MKKYSSLLVLVIAFLVSCERDDICLDPTTPNLIILFYDVDNPSNLKKVDSLYVWSVGLDSIYKNQKLDSIAIPLDTNTNQTIYNFSKGSIEDQITINYTAEEVFVSRSCGFKTYFNNTTIDPFTTNWIQNTEITHPNINNENEAHVKIYH